MKLVFGVGLIIAGIAFGVYVGLWLCLVGGIIQIVGAFQASPVVGMDIALGIIRILFAGAAGGLSAFVAVIPGMAICANA